MPRSTKEWVGRTSDHMPPATVRQRILERANFTCHVCQGQIDKPGWHADHVPPLKDGGENRESKIKPAHDVCHRRLTAQQAVERAPIERKKLAHTGAARPAGNLKSRGFPALAKPVRENTKSLPPRAMFWRKGEIGQPLRLGESEGE